MQEGDLSSAMDYLLDLNEMGSEDVDNEDEDEDEGLD